MSIELANTLRVLSHELRTPIGVMQGYLRMLIDGRVAEDAKPRVLAQLQQAATRLAALGRETSELARWTQAGARDEWRPVSFVSLVDAARASATAAARVRSADLRQVAAREVRTFDLPALSAACAAAIDATARETGSDLQVVARAPAQGTIDLLIGSVDQPDLARVQGPGDAGSTGPRLERGGLGLSLIIAATVLDAHGGALWQVTDHPGLLGVRFSEEHT